MKVRNSLFVFLLAALLLSSCLPNGIPLTPAPSATTTAAPTLTATATLPAPTATVEPPTPTPLPTDTETATAMPSATTAPATPATPTAAVNAANCYRASLASDTTDPADTTLAATQKFTKVWRLVNQGSCTWSADFQIVSSFSGYAPGGAGSFRIGISVPPLHFVDITLTLTAPKINGNYGGSYKLASTDGTVFGIGSDGTGTFGFLVPVETINTPSAFSVTRVEMSVNDSSVDVSCPDGFKFVFSANIHASAAGDVTYHWIFSNGDTTDKETITFDEKGDTSVSTSWRVEESTDGWAQIYIDSPNHQAFSKVHFKIDCH